jgi:hypothetical protein
MEYKPHTRILSIIKHYNNLKLKILKFKIYKEKTNKSKTNANISKIYMKQSEAIEIYIQRILSNLKRK